MYTGICEHMFIGRPLFFLCIKKLHILLKFTQTVRVHKDKKSYNIFTEQVGKEKKLPPVILIYLLVCTLIIFVFPRWGVMNTWRKICDCSCWCGSPLNRPFCTCTVWMYTFCKYLFLGIHVRSGVEVCVPLFIVRTFTIGVARRGSLQWYWACVVSVLELQIISRIIILESVFGASFVWVTPCHIDMEWKWLFNYVC